MITFFNQCGFFGWPLLVLTIVNAALVARAAIRLAARRAAPPIADPSLNSILFWGVIAAVMGFLGQYIGIYKALQVIMKATAIDPRIVAAGMAESFTTTLWGLTLFLLSALAWFGLSAWNRRPVAAGD